MKKILLVEDDPYTIDVYKTFLKKEDYHIDVAIDQKTALEKIINNHPDLLLLDMNLHPDVSGPEDGLSILKAIRQDPRTKNLKVIVLSNYNNEDYPELSNLAELGVVKSFVKVQSSPEEIINVIKEILK